MLLGSLLYWQFDALLAWQGGVLLRSPQREDRTPKLQERKDAFAPQSSLTKPETYMLPVVEPQSSEAIASTSPEPPVAPKPEEQELRKTAVVKITEPESQSSSNTVAEPSSQKFPLTRAVKKGDYLSKMIADIYGKSSTQRVQWIKMHNPQIHDADQLPVGMVIIFPAPDEFIDG